MKWFKKREKDRIPTIEIRELVKVQTRLGDIVGSVPGHSNNMNDKVMFTVYCSLLSMQ